MVVVDLDLNDAVVSRRIGHVVEKNLNRVVGLFSSHPLQFVHHSLQDATVELDTLFFSQLDSLSPELSRCFFDFLDFVSFGHIVEGRFGPEVWIFPNVPFLSTSVGRKLDKPGAPW